MTQSNEHVLGLCNRWHVPDYSAAFKPRLMLTFMDPGAQRPSLGAHKPEHWEVIEIHDIASRPLLDDRRWILPARKHIERILQLANRWKGQGRLLVNCDAGISRSSAGLLTLAAAVSPHRIEQTCQTFRRLAPWVDPNPRMIRLADEALGLKGSLIKAVQAIGAPSYEGRATPICFALI